MTIQHGAITDDADIHEPKGIGSASAGTVYMANGSTSGNWVYPPCKPHAEIYITSGTTAHTLAGSSAYSLLNPSGEWTDSTNNDILTVTPASGQINLNQSGHYYISFWMTFTTAAIASGSVYNVKYAIDGATSPRKVFVSKPTNGADTITIASSGTVGITATQTLSIFMAGDATSSGTNIIPVEAGLTALYLD